MAQLHGRPSHLLDRTATVRPVGMQMAVAPQTREQRLAPSASGTVASVSSRSRYSGTRPASASRITWPVLGPMPLTFSRVPRVTRSASSSPDRSSTASAARRNARTRYVAPCERSSRNAIRRKAVAGSISTSLAERRAPMTGTSGAVRNQHRRMPTGPHGGEPSAALPAPAPPAARGPALWSGGRALSGPHTAVTRRGEASCPQVPVGSVNVSTSTSRRAPRSAASRPGVRRRSPPAP